jgi:hypothetical protein
MFPDMPGRLVFLGLRGSLTSLGGPAGRDMPNGTIGLAAIARQAKSADGGRGKMGRASFGASILRALSIAPRTLGDDVKLTPGGPELTIPASEENPKDTGLQLENFTWLLRHPPPLSPPDLAISDKPDPADDGVLIERVLRAYHHSLANFSRSEGMWDTVLYGIKRDVHEALSGSDRDLAAEVLRNPAKTAHFWGFDAIAAAPPGHAEPHEQVIRTLNTSADLRPLFALWLYDSLVSLAEAIGGRRTAYPEAGPAAYDIRRAPASAADEILDSIDAVLAAPITFPNPYPGELGLKTRRGIVGFRAIQGVYQAWRIAQIASGRTGYRVLEIGAGLGRTAYYASCFGVTDYTIIDIPLTTAAQGYFLGRTLGADRISLPGESPVQPLRILAAHELETLAGPFDLVFNADSWTELSPDIAKRYWDFAWKVSSRILSINHEFNPFTVRSLYVGDPAITAVRYPYWMRNGYVEEYLTMIG